MHNLQLRSLKNFCRKWDLDTHLIDNTLTFSENKTILMSQVHTFDLESRMEEWATKQEEYDHYVREHFLSFYVTYVRDGTTKSAIVGEPDTSAPQFSLREYVVMHK